MGLYGDTRAQRGGGGGLKRRIINSLTEPKRNPNCSEKESFNTHPSSIQRRRLVVIIRAASTVISSLPSPSRSSRDQPFNLNIRPSSLLLSVHTLLILRAASKFPFHSLEPNETTNPFSNSVYICVCVCVYPSKLVFAFCRRHYLHSRNSSRTFFAQEPRREINSPDIYPPPPNRGRRGTVVIVARFRRIPGYKVSRNVNTIKERPRVTSSGGEIKKGDTAVLISERVGYAYR